MDSVKPEMKNEPVPVKCLMARLPEPHGVCELSITVEAKSAFDRKSTQHLLLGLDKPKVRLLARTLLDIEQRMEALECSDSQS